jgi:1-deoxy-D-xylulose-5-phosphate reductoisomerase
VAKRILLLGSTGSIGRQVLDVCERLGGQIEVVGLAAARNADLVAEQARKWRASYAALTQGATLDGLPDGCRALVGPDAMAEMAGEADYDMLVVSVSGMIGLKPTLIALQRGKTIALASKEVLVAAGQAVTRAITRQDQLLPIDSEHSAIFQCLDGRGRDNLDQVILTASGGPFRGWTRDQLATVTPDMALAHPTWRMGPKITIDSATLMNKGLEVIEAHWLFGLPPEKIEVVVHPQSILHSIVQFVDGSMLAQLGYPDMRMPIQVALLHPERQDTGLERFDFSKSYSLSLEPVDENAFPCLRLAYEALEAGGTMPAVLNGANEALVPMFLDGKITFMDIPRILESVMADHPPVEATLEAVIAADIWARDAAKAKTETVGACLQ